MSTSGGAGRAALRLHQSLRELGADSHMVVFDAGSADDQFIHRATDPLGKLAARYMRNIDKLPFKLYRNRSKTHWSNNFAPNFTLRQVLKDDPDIIHLHWVGAGVLPIHDFPRFGRPIIWTLHDMWAFTGGCHLTGGCDRFRESCGRCPKLGSSSIQDLSHKNWKRKDFAWKSLDMTIVCPSNWMARECRQSSLLTHKSTLVIHNGIDLHRFRPQDRFAAREALGFPQDKFLIAFGASAVLDQNKGHTILQDALRVFNSQEPESNCELVVFGAGVQNSSLFSVPTRNLGFITDDRQLALIYSAADVFCAPSREENLATTAIESLACGTPVVAFNIGGFPDIIEHRVCGYLADPFNAQSFAEGLYYLFSRCRSSGACTELRSEARRRAEALFDSRAIARRHLEVYQGLL